MSEAVLSTVGLTRRFGSLTAVDGLDMDVPGGAITGFLGANGAGKTTTLRMVLGLIRPHAGAVRLFGRPLFQRGRARLPAGVGALVEMPSLYGHLSGRCNLEISRRLLDLPASRIDAVLERVRLTEHADRPAGQYSLGMRQRLGLALALLGEPRLLILDEPTNGLDPAGIQEMRDLIRELPRQGVTVLLSSHLLSEVEQTADHLVILHRGRRVFQGACTELQARRRACLDVGVDRVEAATDLVERAGWRVLDTLADGVRLDAEGRDDSRAVCRLLVEAGLEVHRLQVRQPSLESIFLGLTEDGEP